MIVSGLTKMCIQPRRLRLSRRKAGAVLVRAGWKPMHLLWARRRRQASTARPLPGRGTAISHHSTVLHLHFAMLHSLASASHRISIHGARATKVVQHIYRAGDRSSPVQMLAKTASSPVKGHRDLLIQRRETMRQRQRKLWLETSEHQRVHRNIGSTIVALVKPAALVFSSTLRPIAAPTADVLAPISPSMEAKPAMLVHRRPQLAATLSSLRRADTHDAAVPASLHRRAPDLIWRIESEERTSGGVIESPVRRTTMPSAAPVNAGRQVQSNFASPSPRIDAAMIDKIVENVIGKMERRMRVERERRGL